MKPSPHLNLFEAIAQGIIEAPAGDDHPNADRWQWFADLYANRTWGLVAAIDGFPRLAADQIAAACRDTATDTATIEQWHAIADIARTARTAAHSPGLDIAWSAVADTCTDALDHLAGHTFGGLEAILGALDATWHEHDTPIAMSFVRDAYTAWQHRIAPPATSERNVA
ncbi:hypothetical protein LQ384_26225 [Rhodococcus rhodochrous]|uniref:DUF4254 domain-containing protein n=1 Tax=Rhodococcus rhodochrous TaxID=1829 RepID=A0AAW4XMW0_RHORH|nr:hypothetical protein [Rhodococcus rhodochrous]MCD2114604.1 hypothetical protein [Rhodococcus rhodochrous]